MIDVGPSRTTCLLLLVLILVVIGVVVNLVKKRDYLFNSVFVSISFMVLFAGGKIVDLNTLSDVQREQIQQVVDRVGDAGSYITVDSGRIYVLVNGEWLDVNNIQGVKRLASDIVLVYDGEEIYLGHSGVYNAIQVLKDVGLIGGGKE